jgi:uncharacterized protein
MTKIFATLLLMLGFAHYAAAGTQTKAIVVQANGNQQAFESAFRLSSNIREVLKHARIEIVVFGPAVKFLTEDSPEEPLVQKMQQEGIQVIACGRSMKTDRVAAKDLVPSVKIVPFGAVYILNRQKQGWQYFRP